MSRWSLRPEVMLEADAAGGITLVDPLFERALVLTGGEVAALDAAAPEALARLDTMHLRATPETDALRRAAWFARLRPTPSTSTPAPHDDATVLAAATAAARLPWAPAWRRPERWRRLLERGLASPAPLRLPGLFPTPLVRAAAAQAAAAEHERLVTALLKAERAPVREATGGALGALRAALDAPAFRRACGIALGRTLNGPLHLNAWHLAPGEAMGIHPDGARYAGTVVVGLNRGWRAADGGAIAFGLPGGEGLAVSDRWLPEAGDVLLFAPTPFTWHCVEPTRRERRTLSGWWLSAS